MKIVSAVLPAFALSALSFGARAQTQVPAPAHQPTLQAPSRPLTRDEKIGRVAVFVIGGFGILGIAAGIIFDENRRRRQNQPEARRCFSPMPLL